jgi:hypothetical protein
MSQVCISETICEYDGEIYKISENPLEAIKKCRSGILHPAGEPRHTALSESSVPMKYKFLIAMSLGGPAGAMNGVQRLAIGVMNKEAQKKK